MVIDDFETGWTFFGPYKIDAPLIVDLPNSFLAQNPI
jgi:hypothetical protein